MFSVQAQGMHLPLVVQQPGRCAEPGGGTSVTAVQEMPWAHTQEILWLYSKVHSWAWMCQLEEDGITAPLSFVWGGGLYQSTHPTEPS